ncbi:MAG: glycosyltransferase family 8 protein [Endomicrobiaceae bacterium]|nr:glycosyltransferase family 8 protein [Endomicrobiaceae bacterium]
MSVENKKKLIDSFKNKNCNINFINTDTTILDNLPEYKISSHITKEGYLRLFVAEYLKDIDKIIYLDCDTIVVSDIRDLFLTDIENYYIAAVEDAGLIYNICFYSKFYETFNSYINAGVLLINLKLWRKDNLSYKLINAIDKNKENFLLGDQDAINLVCRDKIKFIPFSYNLQTNAFDIKNFLPNSIKSCLKQSLKEPHIIHYSTHQKPWNRHTHLKSYYLKYEIDNPFVTNNYLTFRTKHFCFFIYYLLKRPFSYFRNFVNTKRVIKNRLN